MVTTDLSGPMVEAATRALADLPNVTVQRADAVATGLPDAGADGVVMVNLLHIVPDAAAVLAEARRLLRPGGALVAVDRDRAVGLAGAGGSRPPAQPVGAAQAGAQHRPGWA